MQNRYVGDLSDFGKHGLLRFLTGEPVGAPSLGVIWCLHHDEVHGQNPMKMSDDGKHLTYLERSASDDKEAFRSRDPELWEHLRDLVFRGARCVHCVEREHVLPDGTVFYGDSLEFPRTMTRPVDRREHRRLWWERALKAVAGADLVYVDPDNSINSKPTVETHARSNKFVYVGELRQLWDAGHSLVVYHTPGMNEDAPDAVRAKAHTLRDTLGPEASVTPFLFRQGTAPAFFVCTQPDARGAAIKRRVSDFGNSPWAEVFSRVPA